MHHLDSWIKIDQLEVTCFIISLFTAQHVSNVSTLSSGACDLLWIYFVCCIALVRCVLVLRCGSAWWCGILMQTSACIRIIVDTRKLASSDFLLWKLLPNRHWILKTFGFIVKAVEAGRHFTLFQRRVYIGVLGLHPVECSEPARGHVFTSSAKTRLRFAADIPMKSKWERPWDVVRALKTTTPHFSRQ